MIDSRKTYFVSTHAGDCITLADSPADALNIALSLLYPGQHSVSLSVLKQDVTVLPDGLEAPAPLN